MMIVSQTMEAPNNHAGTELHVARSGDTRVMAVPREQRRERTWRYAELT